MLQILILSSLLLLQLYGICCIPEMQEEWIWNIDLGSSFVNAFSFYNLGSPFYWISLLFPRGSFPYLAGFLYILKYVVASMTAYLYLRLFAEDRRYAVIGALLYAFSGFQTTNLEFFHFHDVTAVFPLMLSD